VVVVLLTIALQRHVDVVVKMKTVMEFTKNAWDALFVRLPSVGVSIVKRLVKTIPIGNGYHGTKQTFLTHYVQKVHVDVQQMTIVGIAPSCAT